MADEIDTDTVVHYPEVAADSRHLDRYAVSVIAATKTEVTVFVMSDDGNTWVKLTPPQPDDVKAVTRPAVAFSPSGILVAAWRGIHANDSYDIYPAATDNGKSFGRAVRVSIRASSTPGVWANTYAVRGDFHTSVAASKTDAHPSWADARNGADVRDAFAHVPLQGPVRVP